MSSSEVNVNLAANISVPVLITTIAVIITSIFSIFINTSSFSGVALSIALIALVAIALGIVSLVILFKPQAELVKNITCNTSELADSLKFAQVINIIYMILMLFICGYSAYVFFKNFDEHYHITSLRPLAIITTLVLIINVVLAAKMQCYQSNEHLYLLYKIQRSMAAFIFVTFMASIVVIDYDKLKEMAAIFTRESQLNK